MFNVPPFTPEILLIWRDGFILRFNSLAAASQAARARRLFHYYRTPEIGLRFGAWDSYTRILGCEGLGAAAAAPRKPHIIARTELGDVIDPRDLEKATLAPWRISRCAKANSTFRRDPVPHRGKISARGYYRHPKTQREIREQGSYLDSLNDAGLTPRNVGRIRNLPTAWDDSGRNVDRCWKSHRQKQHRPQ